MSHPQTPGPEPFWRTVGTLWKFARRRQAGRRKRIRQLRLRKKSSSTDTLGGFAIFLSAILMSMVHGFLGYTTVECMRIASLRTADQQGRLVVRESLLHNLQRGGDMQNAFINEASWRQRQFGDDFRKQYAALYQQYNAHGKDGFISEHQIPATLARVREMPPLAQLTGALAFLLWLTMLTCQGEGLDLDVQRKRHPMWEWLLSHPVHPAAAVMAEMVSPMVSNPAYLSAPVYWIVLFGQSGHFGEALWCGLIIGGMFALVTAFLNKTLELCAMLKLSVRTRGGVLGIMSWLGYALFLLPLCFVGKPGVLVALTNGLAPLAPYFHPPIIPWLVGDTWHGGFSPPHAILSAFILCAALGTLCAVIAKWGMTSGLEGGFDSAPQTPRLLKLSGRSRFGKEPLYRKEMLWFLRDRSALVQAVLIPLTIAGLQAFNLRNVVQLAGMSWNTLCGMAVICGTYFLMVLGPRSLSSEGPALWLALTWPRGLEDLLKTKARLWWYLSSIIVAGVLIFAAVKYPADIWPISLVAVGWWFFGRSLAEKAVTLVTVTSSSGEPEPTPRSRQWSAMLGTLAFGSGILSRNWHLACIGVVFSSLTAAAMWQNLRARLPYLFDPWSEKLPKAPTLLHAMVAIAAMAEGVAMVTAFTTSLVGSAALDLARAAAYGLGSLITYAIVARFLYKRGVSALDVWQWEPEPEVAASASAPGASAETVPMDTRRRFDAPLFRSMALGILAGGALGLAALGYHYLLRFAPALHDFLAPKAHGEQLQFSIWWLALLAVGFAPFAEEYLFRGLLYRALDREWGGWKAMLGSAAFFAIYHPPISWLPVGALGVLNAYLFKRTRRLGGSVMCHLVYNAVVVFTAGG